MPVTAGLVAGGAKVLSGIIGGIRGGKQKREGEALLSTLSYPKQSIPTAILENQANAKQMANEGLPSEQYNRAMNNLKRQQAAAIFGSKNKRGGLMAIPAIQQQPIDATLKLDTADAEARRRNQLNLQSVNNTVGGWQDKVWDNNVKQKYIKDYNYAMGLIGRGKQNIANAIDQGLSGLAGSANSLIGGGGFGGGGAKYNVGSYGGGQMTELQG